MPRKARRWTMSEQEMKSLLKTMKTMGHEELAHNLFFDCFPELGSVLQIGGMKTTSLFRMALLYFLFVPDGRERLLKRLRSLPERKGGNALSLATRCTWLAGRARVGPDTYASTG